MAHPTNIFITTILSIYAIKYCRVWIGPNRTTYAATPVYCMLANCLPNWDPSAALDSVIALASLILKNYRKYFFLGSC